MNVELKPCPFCGNTSKDTSSGDGMFPAFRGGGWIARCGNPYCFAEVIGETKEDCASRWNRRTPEHPE
jgi:hypothetical protein